MDVLPWLSVGAVAGVKVTPPGSDPVSARVGVGEPVSVTVKVPAVPWVKEAWLAEVMVGAVVHHIAPDPGTALDRFDSALPANLGHWLL